LSVRLSVRLSGKFLCVLCILCVLCLLCVRMGMSRHGKISWRGKMSKVISPV
jgi:hypothetical protein